MRNLFRSSSLSFTFIVGMLLLIPALGVADTDRVKSVGSQLMCICGCGQVLTECNHIHCPSSVPMTAELKDHLAAGMTDSQVFATFVDKYGAKVRAAPAFSGIFNRTAWFTPFAALLAGMAGLIFYLRRMKKSMAPPAPATTAPSSYDQKIEDELNKFTPED